jgi:flagellar hook-associated protein 2
MAGTISFSGISSGIDFTSMITKLVEAESSTKNSLEDWRDTWQNKWDELDTLSSKLSSVMSTMKVLQSSSSFYNRTATSSSTEVAEIAVDSTAEPGAYNLTVGSSINHIMESRGYSASTDVVLDSSGGAQSLQVSAAGQSYTVTNGTDKTLDDIVSEINSNMTSVHAEVVSDNSSSNPYRLKLTAANGGTANAITMTQTGTSAFSNAIDNIETVDAKGGATLTATGTYTGTVNNRFSFEVAKTATIGNGTTQINWSDSATGKSGTLTVSSGGTYNITQGVKLTFANGETYNEGAQFALDVFAPNIQQAQDSGLAQASKEVHSGYCDADTTSLTSVEATFSYNYAGNKVADIFVPAGTTLQGLADLINEDSDNPGVKATVVNDGTGTNTAFHLVMTSTKTGAANAISGIDISSFTNSLFNHGTGTEFTETQKATNAMVRIDGYPTGSSWLQYDSNLITDLVNGASVSLKGSGSTSFTVENDADSMAQKVQDFTDAYNDVMSYISEIAEVKYSDSGTIDEEDTGDLVGNYGVLTVQSELKSFIITRGNGYIDGNDPIMLLSQVGISLGDDEELDFDADAFKAALADTPTEVVDYFTDNMTAVTNSPNLSVYSSTPTSFTKAGLYHYKVEVDASGNATSARYWLDGDTEANGWNLAIDPNGKLLTATSGGAKGMAFQLSGATSTTLEGTLQIKEGKAHQFEDVINKLNDSEDGTIPVLKDNYTDIMDGIDKKIDREEDRLEQYQDRLEQRYARLETTLNTYNSRLTQLQSQLSKLG